MKDKTLHLVSFDQPYPPNYGGIIDVFFKLKALHEAGCKIHFHCFTFNPQVHEELERYAEKVYYYKINQSPLYIFNRVPLSIASRNGRQLASNIARVKAPILFESLKTIDALRFVEPASHSIFIRLHNIEKNYFKGIAKSEKNVFKRFLFHLEAIKYKHVEQKLNTFDKVFTLSKFESRYVNKRAKNACFIPVFHGNSLVKELSKFGDFALYHGDLRASDNRKVVSYLIELFRGLPYPLRIASSTHQDWVTKQIKEAENIQFVQLTDFNHLLQLFKQAHINISWSFQQSGTKLKVINALFNSRFSIINTNIVDDPIINKLCISVNTEQQLKEAILLYKDMPYEHVTDRAEVLEYYLSDKINAQNIMNQIFN